MYYIVDNIRTYNGGNMEEKKVYELTPAQDVVYLQSKLSIHKNVVNIVSSLSLDEEIDFELLKKAFNKVVERNDCLRIRFFKKGKKLLQCFEEKRELANIPVHNFNTEEEQNEFISKFVKSPIRYLKGVVVEPIFIKTFDGKSMVLMKVCHLVLDIYGINIIYKDLLDVYKAIKNGEDLPAAPVQFDDCLQTPSLNSHREPKTASPSEKISLTYMHEKAVLGTMFQYVFTSCLQISLHL